MKSILSIVTALALWTSAAAAQDEAVRCGDLPPAVSETKAAIRDAAAARDYAALAKLADPATFTYSFGGGGDPVAYWTSVDGEGTDIRATIVALLDMSCATFAGDENGPYYEWPAAAEIPYAELTEDETAALQQLYAGRLEEQYVEGPEVGYYVGWRLLINQNGRWETFVAGD